MQSSSLLFLPEDILVYIFMLNGIVRKIPGTNEVLAFDPGEILKYRLICKYLDETITRNKNQLGLKHADEARALDNQMKKHPASFYRISEMDFEGIKRIYEELVVTYPLSTHHIIGIGNSPTIVNTYIQIRNPNASVTHLPIGRGEMRGTKRKAMKALTTNLPMGSMPLTLNSEYDWQSHKENFIEYFDIFLTNATKDFFERNMDLVVIDYVASGSSIRTARDHIVRYLCEKLLEKMQMPFLLEKFNSLTFDEKRQIIIFVRDMTDKKNINPENFLDNENNLILKKDSQIILNAFKHFLNPEDSKILNAIKLPAEKLNEFARRVKIFSFLSPSPLFDFRFNFELAETKLHSIFLPPTANARIELWGDPVLNNLNTQFAARNFKDNFRNRMFPSKSYNEIKRGYFEVGEAFPDQLRSAAGLNRHEKKRPRHS